VLVYLSLIFVKIGATIRCEHLAHNAHHLRYYFADLRRKVVILVGRPVAGGVIDRDRVSFEVRKPLQSALPPVVSGADGKHYGENDRYSDEHVRKLCGQPQAITDIR